MTSEYSEEDADEKLQEINDEIMVAINNLDNRYNRYRAKIGLFISGIGFYLLPREVRKAMTSGLGDSDDK